VGLEVGLNLQDYWKLETRKLGQTDFHYFADGTAQSSTSSDFTVGNRN